MKLSSAILANIPSEKISLEHSVPLEKVEEFKEKMNALLSYEFSSPQVEWLMAEIDTYEQRTNQ